MQEGQGKGHFYMSQRSNMRVCIYGTEKFRTEIRV